MLFGKLFKGAKDALGRRYEKGVVTAANEILKLANVYCPIETGELRASGHVEQEGRGFDTVVKVVYGGPTAPYAIFVHENLEKKHAPPTQAKFLERAAREKRRLIARKVGAAIDKPAGMRDYLEGPGRESVK